MNVKIIARALYYYYYSFRAAASGNGMDTRSKILQSASAVNGSSWCTNNTWFTSPLALAENFKFQVCYHYFTLSTVIFYLMSRPWRGSDNSICLFFFNDDGHVMIHLLFLLFLFVDLYAEGKAHGQESTAIRRPPLIYFSQASRSSLILILL